MSTFSVGVEQGDTLLSCFSFHPIRKCPLCSLFSPIFLCLLLVILLFKVAPSHSADVLSRVPKDREKTLLLDKLHSNTNYNTVGCEFNVNESIRYIK